MVPVRWRTEGRVFRRRLPPKTAADLSTGVSAQSMPEADRRSSTTGAKGQNRVLDRLALSRANGDLRASAGETRRRG